ncbi:MAG TPA: hypothetical protein VEI03_15790 [Stellaceae bacterium]|nr:hypothetical protein [Stellaceae bacterium]
MAGTDLAKLIEEWHDFYLLIGTTAATLVGLLFVSASVGGGYMTEERRPGIRAFFSPTIFHFAAVLVACLALLAPKQSWAALGALLLGCGLAGLLYAGWIWRQMARQGYLRDIDAEDRVWYARVPVACHLLVTLAAALLLLRWPAGIDVLAVTLVLLLLVGIRNAWDITLWLVMRTGKK